ncbi:MAG: hypothetical protein KF773_33505 [Deltaproteobacteria bacterium]|nr:hypothetical protein [Deltaproteobacteria bacterium]MCW5809108.1 hypothetical protein [Deltaproteobacteria bacterium]
MISPGGRFRPAWLWTRPRRTWTYTRRRRGAVPAQKRRAPSPVAPYTGDMLFDQTPRELPVATVHTRGRAAVAAALQRWLAAKWTWLRPRSVPVLVAFVGMLAVVGSVNALTHFARKAPAPPVAALAPPEPDPAQAVRALTTAEPPPPALVFAVLPSQAVRFIPLCSR